MIRTLLIGLIGLLLVLVVVGIWLPDRVTASYATTIDVSVDNTYRVLNDLETLPAWSPWDGAAVKADYTFSSPATGSGAWAAWSGSTEQAGSGDIRIANTEFGKALNLAVAFDDAGSGDWRIQLEPQGSRTRLTFEYSSSLSEGAGPFYGLLLRYGRGLVQRSIEEAMARGLRDFEAGFDDSGRWRGNQNEA